MIPKDLAETDLSDSAFRLLVHLISKQQADGWAPYTQSFIADRLGWGPEKVKTASELLDGRGIIAIGGNRNEVRSYAVLWDPPHGKNPVVDLDYAEPTRSGRAGRRSKRMADLLPEGRHKRARYLDKFNRSSHARVSPTATHSVGEDPTPFSSLSGEGLGEELGEDLGELRIELDPLPPTDAQVRQIRNLPKKLGWSAGQVREEVLWVCGREVEKAEDLNRDEAADLIGAMKARLQSKPHEVLSDV
jgi:hypothetical protein